MDDDILELLCNFGMCYHLWWPLGESRSHRLAYRSQHEQLTQMNHLLLQNVRLRLWHASFSHLFPE